MSQERQRHPPSRNPEWDDGYTTGYEAGIEHGILLGRGAMVQELLPVGAYIAGLRLSRTTAHEELRRRRTTYANPPLSAQEIRERAEASWAPLSTNPVNTTTHQEGSHR